MLLEAVEGAVDSLDGVREFGFGLVVDANKGFDILRGGRMAIDCRAVVTVLSDTILSGGLGLAGAENRFEAFFDNLFLDLTSCDLPSLSFLLLAS